MTSTHDIYYETLTVANLVLTKKLITTLLTTNAMSAEAITHLMRHTATEITRSTLPITQEGAQQALELFLAGTSIDPRTIWPNT